MTAARGRPRSIIIVLVAAGALSVPAHARTLDRRAAIRMALGQNPQIAAARAEEAALVAQGKQVDATRMPNVTLDAGVGPALVASLVPGTAVQSVQEQYGNYRWSDLSTVWIGELRIVQPLYTFGKIALRAESATHGLHAREAQTRMQKADVAFVVAQIYEGYLYARDAERFFLEIDHWFDSTLQTTQEKLARNMAGVRERDVLRLQSAQGLMAMGLHQARAGLAQARAGLIAYLGLPADETLAFVEDELMPVGQIPDEFSTMVRQADEKRPELLALREGQQALLALGRAEAAGWWPNFFLMGFLSVAYTPGRDWVQSRFIVDPLNHFAPGALLGLHWELQGNLAGARAAEQRAHADVLDHMGQWATAGIPAEVRKAYEDVMRARKDVDAGLVAVKKARQWMVQASADYGVGLLDVREVSDAVDAYFTLRMAILKARYDHNVAMASLSKATGTLDSGGDLFYLAPPAAQSTNRGTTK